jgi:hypothetical protein
MTEHMILRNLFGLDARPARWRYSALVLLDCQNTYRHGVLTLDGVEMAVAEAARLLHRARAAKIPYSTSCTMRARDRCMTSPPRPARSVPR